MPAEQFAESRNVLAAHPREGLGGHIAAGEAGAAGGDHHVNTFILTPAVEERDNIIGVIAQQHAFGNDVVRSFDPFDEYIAGFVFRQRAAIRYGQNCDPNGDECPTFVNRHFERRSLGQAALRSGRAILGSAATCLG